MIRPMISRVAALLPLAVLVSCGGSGRATLERAQTFPTDRRSHLDTSDSAEFLARHCPAPKVCPVLPDPRVVGLPAGVDTALWMKLDSLTRTFHDPSGGILGAAVLRSRDSSVVWQRYPDLRILPASTMKVLTVAAALEDLGPEFRWKTQVWATGPVVKGVLKGNLVLEGGGDPTLGVDGPGMSPLVAAVVRAGIREVHGSVVALDTMVGRDDDVWPSGWTHGNSRDGYGAPVAGLNWGQNRTASRSIAEPRKLALMVFAKSLAARKVRVAGTDTTILARGDGIPDRRDWTLLGKVQSPRLSEVLRTCLVHSVNPYAEATLLALGVRKPNPKFAPREQGKRRLRQILTSMGVPSSVFVDDGSGLSRYDLVTARAMAGLLQRDLGRADGLRVSDLMARGGQGTLRYRFGRLAPGMSVSGKTGTLNGTSCLVGLLRVPGRDTLSFAFLSTGYQGSAQRIRAFQDRLVMALAGLDAPIGLDTTSTPDVPSDDDDSLRVDPGPPLPPYIPDSVAAKLLQPAAPDSAKALPDTVCACPVRPVPLDLPLLRPDSLDTPTAPRVPDSVPSDSVLPAPIPAPAAPSAISPDGVPVAPEPAPMPAPDSTPIPDVRGTAIDANESRSTSDAKIDSLPGQQTTPPAPGPGPERDSGSPLVPSGTDPDKVTP